jgi:hypothetical protein
LRTASATCSVRPPGRKHGQKNVYGAVAVRQKKTRGCASILPFFVV